MNASKKILVTGGIKSGKSRFALERAMETSGEKIFLATAQAVDEVMKRKIANHREERALSFNTIEEPLYLARALDSLKGEPELILIDCLTVWIGNLFHHFNDIDQIREQKRLFLNTLQSINANIIIVTNEVGLGVTPDNQLSRTYIDELGLLNQEVAGLCHEVIMVISGLPQVIKGGNTYANME